MARAQQRDDLVGQKFGLLTVASFSHIDTLRRAIWNCKCACGNDVKLATSVMKSGHNISCGCAWRERIAVGKLRHGMTGTKVWAVWIGMRNRCYKPVTDRYPQYGGRGIKVCDRWHLFENFYADMGDVPEGMSIDRIDVDGDYCPENCRWATSMEQGANKTNTLYVTLHGKEYLFGDLIKAAGLKHSTAHARLYRYGWTPERTFHTLDTITLHSLDTRQDTRRHLDTQQIVSLPPHTLELETS